MKPIKGVVQDAGGGMFTVLVDRDTESYPGASDDEGTDEEWLAEWRNGPVAQYPTYARLIGMIDRLNDA